MCVCVLDLYPNYFQIIRIANEAALFFSPNGHEKAFKEGWTLVSVSVLDYILAKYDRAWLLRIYFPLHRRLSMATDHVVETELKTNNSLFGRLVTKLKGINFTFQRLP